MLRKNGAGMSQLKPDDTLIKMGKKLFFLLLFRFHTHSYIFVWALQHGQF